MTIPQKMMEAVREYSKLKCLAHKVNGKWKFWTYEEYLNDIKAFANALLALGIPPFKTLNIIGYNHPAWFISFHGSLFANVIPVGVYTTNGPDACHYVASHSEAQVVLVENQEHLNKYLKIWDRLPQLKYIIIYNDKIPESIPMERKNNVLLFQDVMELGRKHSKETNDKFLNERLEAQRPGNCCTLVYTSGTTGLPKAVMLSHDNYTWAAHTYKENAYWEHTATLKPEDTRSVSYLPLSHVAAQFADMILPIYGGACVYIAEPTALQGTLIETLKEVRPTHIVSVPRIWEKVEETMKRIGKENGWAKQKIGIINSFFYLFF